MSKKSRLVYEFGPYRLNLDQCLLTRDGKSIILRPKLFDLLTVLVEHNGQMLEKEELLDAVWGPNSSIEESNIAVSVNALRKALGDDLCIETVARRGYRLAAEVKIVAAEASRDVSSGGGVVEPPSTSVPPGGAVPLHSSLYISRSTDDEFHAAIARRDSIVLVKGARQVGKTSLLARGLQRGREAGTRVVLTDFQHFTSDAFESPGKLLLTLAELMTDQLSLDLLPQQMWKDFISPSSNFERFLRREVLSRVTTPLVWGLDEVDRLFNCAYASEIFGLFRSWHNLRALDPTGPWHRFTIALAYATEAHLFISDLHQSPFNVGTRLALEDFTLEQVMELNQRYGGSLSQSEVESYFDLVGGHPYLLQRGFYEVKNHGMSLASILSQAEQGEGIFGDHLRRMLLSLDRDATLREAVGQVIHGRPGLSHMAFYRLRSAGVLTGDSAATAKPRCRLYANYLRTHVH